MRLRTDGGEAAGDQRWRQELSGFVCASLNPAKASCRTYTFLPPPSFLLCSPRSLFQPIRHDSTSWLLARSQPEDRSRACAALGVSALAAASFACLASDLAESRWRDSQVCGSDSGAA